jgi:hypothetical protein
LHTIVSEFVTDYYIPEMPARAKTLISAARETKNMKVILRVLTQLHEEMENYQQLHTFEAFCLLHTVRIYLDENSLEPLAFEALEKLKAKAPTCLRLILWPDEENGNELTLVNKFFNSPLCIQQDEVVCCKPQRDEEQICSASVQAQNALTSFTFKVGDTGHLDPGCK